MIKLYMVAIFHNLEISILDISKISNLMAKERCLWEITLCAKGNGLTAYIKVLKNAEMSHQRIKDITITLLYIRKLRIKDLKMTLLLLKKMRKSKTTRM